MPYIITEIYTQKNINEMEIAKEFLKTLDKAGLRPWKIGLFEPLKEIYSFDRAVEMWTTEEPGCYEEDLGMVGKAGGMIGKAKEPNFRFDMHWWRHPSQKSINNISFYMSQKSFTKKRDVLIDLFKYSILLFDAFYGYISHEIPQERQHVTGTIETRIPGVFWCNFYENKYVDFFGKKRLLSFPWYKTEAVDNSGIICFLTESPHKELLASDELERRAQIHLGIDSFGELEEYIKNPTKIQYRNVPSLK